MKPIMLAAALALFVGLSTSSIVNNRCDKDDRCTTLSSASLLPRDAPNASKFQDAKAVALRHSRTQDANGNSAIGIVKSRKTGALARVGAVYAARFQPISMIWKQIMAHACSSWAGLGRAAVRVRVSTRAEKP